jgi:hypothetical protein
MRPREIFPRMLERQEFQVSELSFASFAGLKARGDCPFVGLPIALSKIFRHSCVYVRPGAGIRTPAWSRCRVAVGNHVAPQEHGSHCTNRNAPDPAAHEHVSDIDVLCADVCAQ